MRHRIIGILFLTLGIEVYAQEMSAVPASNMGEEHGSDVVLLKDDTAGSDTAGKFIAIKNNFVQDALLILNAGVEVGINDHMSLNLPLTFSPYKISETWMFRTFSIQPGFRYWIRNAGQGLFVGPDVHVGWYDVISGLVGDVKTRYQDREGKHPLIGGGLSIGYGWLLGKGKKWGIEIIAGAGYASLNYDMFYNVDNGARFDSRTKDYFGITNLGLNISYRLGSGKDRRTAE